MLLTMTPLHPAQAEQPVTLNLKDADITAVIATVSDITGKNFIIDQRVRGKVTIISARPMSKEEVYQVFLSLLEVNGFDESFNFPGIGEDTDLQRRLEKAGLSIRWITYRAIEYHLWHPLTQVGKEAHQIFDSLNSRGSKTAVKGIREFLPEHKAEFIDNAGKI